MIVYPCTNFFDCLFPQLEDQEEEIFFSHPKFPGVKCSQIGTLYYDETKYALLYIRGCLTLRHLKRGIGCYVGAKSKLVWECFHGQTTTQLINLMDFNPYNCTKDNLYRTTDLTKKEYKERLQKKKEFLKKTVDGLDKFAAKHPYLEPEDVEVLLNLPVWLSTGWGLYRSGKRIRDRGGRKSTYKKHTPDRPDDYDKVKEMFFSGVLYKDIAATLNWGSTLRVRKFVEKHGWKRENPRWKK